MKKRTSQGQPITTTLVSLLMMIFFESQVLAVEAEKVSFFDNLPSIETTGFLEVRAGVRTKNDPEQKDISVLESRLQLELYTYTDWMEFKYKGDVWGDGVTEKGEYETREAWFFLRPYESLDVKIGRQVLTWGTGDLVFINDLFPKDWQSFFIGRDKEYLKAPSDAAKMSFFTNLINIDLVYTPQFDSDRYITGEYISHWSETEQRRVGQNNNVCADKPDGWFQDEEIALRVYKNINNYEIAFYGYFGFWKQPSGQTESGIALFSKLNVYGASARGQVGPGIGNIEFAFYQSVDDKNGLNPLAANSEMRYLAGYTMDLAKDFNVSLQYYIRQLLDYDNYKENFTGVSVKDQNRHIITLQLTKLLMNQNLELSLSSYYSPSDKDAYLRPNIHYKYNDEIALEAGANIFFGEKPYTFFSQFENNSNIYAAVRYNF